MALAMGAELAGQAGLDRKQRIAADRGIASVKDRRHQPAVPRRCRGQMDMRRPVKRQAKPAGKLTDRTILGQGIAAGPDAEEMEPPLAIGPEPATQVVFRLVVRVLVFVFPGGVGMPDLDLGTGQGRAIRPGDLPRDGQRIAAPGPAEVRSQRKKRGIRAIERSRQGGRRNTGAVCFFAADDAIGQAEHIGQKHPFLAAGVGRIADIGQELQERLKFGRGRAEDGKDLERMFGDQTHGIAQTPGRCLGQAMPKLGRDPLSLCARAATVHPAPPSQGSRLRGSRH